MRTEFGRWGGHIETFDIFEGWRDERQLLVQNGLLEAGAPEAKADFATFLHGFIEPSYYQGYERAESQFKRFVGIDSVNSFDEVRIRGINGLTGIGYVGELGDYPALRRTFRPEAAIVVDTYGGTYAMTRKLLRSKGSEVILQRNPRDMGEAMAEFITQLVVSLIVANPNAPDGNPMYSVGRGNQAAVVASETSVVDAVTWLGTQRDDDNRPIRVRARTAVTQNDKVALILRRIINSQLTGATVNDPAATAFPMGTDNAAQGILPGDGIVVDPYFPDPNDVYFFADPDRLAAFVVAFLDGQEQPLIGLEDATVMHLAMSSGNGHDPYTFHGDTMNWKTRHDVGATAVEPKATYRLNPA